MISTLLYSDNFIYFLVLIRLIDYYLWIVFRCFHRKEITTCHHMKGESLHSVCVRVAPLRRRCKSNLFIFVSLHCKPFSHVWHVEFILYTVVYMKITTARSYHYDIIHTQRVAREVIFFYTSFHLFIFTSFVLLVFIVSFVDCSYRINSQSQGQ